MDNSTTAWWPAFTESVSLHVLRWQSSLMCRAIRSVRPFSISLQHFLTFRTLVTQSSCAAIGWRWISMGETFFPLKSNDPANFFVGPIFQSRCHYKSSFPVNIWLILTQSVVFYPTTSDTSCRKVKCYINTNIIACLFLVWQPPVGQGLLIHEVSSSHTQRRTTVSRTPLDEWSDRRRDLYLTTHNTYNREPTISAGERPLTYALDRAATGTAKVIA